MRSLLWREMAANDVLNGEYEGAADFSGVSNAGGGPLRSIST